MSKNVHLMRNILTDSRIGYDGSSVARRVVTQFHQKRPSVRLDGVLKQGIVVSAELASMRRPAVGALDIPLALLAPRRVFARVEDVAAYGWPLVVLLVAVTAIGYATIETGLIDLEVERSVQQGIAALEAEQLDVVERSALSKMIEERRQAGEFMRLINRVRVMVASPVATLATVLLLSAAFYAVVALTGRKPEWHTLLTICVFAGFADVVGAVVRLLFMLRFRTLAVDTSLALAARLINMEGEGAATSTAAVSGLLSAVDPFRIWFWVIVACGLSVTSQLRGWRVWTCCSLFWLTAAVARAALAVASVQPPKPG
ncbi:MAG: YIP1 family protein [Phycisphaerales bacterium]|nr:MAG: YIP1 family protein [Phycisphaerales bacterium]